MMPLSWVTYEVLFTLGTLMLPALLGLAVGDGGLCDGVVVTVAAQASMWMTCVSMSIAVTLLTRFTQRSRCSEGSWQTLITSWPSCSILTIEADMC